MLNRSATIAMSTCVLKALPCKLNIKRHLPSILYTMLVLRGPRVPTESPSQNKAITYLLLTVAQQVHDVKIKSNDVVSTSIRRCLKGCVPAGRK